MDELARVYARSLFEIAREHGLLDELREQLGQFADALDDLVCALFSELGVQQKHDLVLVQLTRTLLLMD